MLTTLRRIDIGSAFRVGLVLYALMFAIFGLIFFLLPTLMFGSLATTSSFNSRTSSDFAFLSGMSLLSFGCFYIIGIVMSAIAGGISLAIIAWLYNLSARWVGGVKFELASNGSDLIDEIERDIVEKRKRGEI